MGRDNRVLFATRMNMSKLERRSFIALSTAGAIGGFSFRDWIASAFRDGQDKAKNSKVDRPAMLRSARRRAVARGKPMLLFVIPEANAQLYGRGQLFGALLNHGGRDLNLDLALCELACAKLSDVTKVLGVKGVKGEPLLLLLEFPSARGTGNKSASAPKCTAIDPKLPPAVRPDPTHDYKAMKAAAKKLIRAKNARIVAALKEVLAPDPGTLAVRADRVRSQLADDEREVVQLFVDGQRPIDPKFAIHTAAILRMAAIARRKDGGDKRILKTLLSAVQQIYIKQRIDGSKWANSQGCGSTIEGEVQQLMVACGMGRVPVLAQRFLYLYDT